MNIPEMRKPDGFCISLLTVALLRLFFMPQRRCKT
nr:MAG TPA: hypothetical protein [Caudoviricetes sp.]